MCECVNWCDVDTTHRLLTGHHENCPHSPKAIDKAIELINDLVKGIESWAKDEDGIHADLWYSYRKAKAIKGEVLEM